MNPNYIVVPIAKNEMLNIYKKVEYVDDVKESTEKIVKRIYGDYDNGRVTISLKELGRYKNKRWAFQEESRFCIAIFPGKVFSNIETFAKELDKWIYTCWVNNIDNNRINTHKHIR